MTNCSATSYQYNPNKYCFKFVYLFYNILQIKAPIERMSDQSHAGSNFLVPVCRVRFKGFPTVGSRVDFLSIN